MWKEDPKKAEEKKRKGNSSFLSIFMRFDFLYLAIIEKQRKLEREEINLKWKYVFGPSNPKKRKEIRSLTNITLRNIWMEDLFLFDQIKQHMPNENFHSPEKYVLVYHLPSNPFTVMISLTDRGLQEGVVRTLSKLKKAELHRILFHFVTIDATLPLFGPKVHPATLVSFNTKPEVLGKLCDQYLEGRITLKDFNSAMDGGYEIWKHTVYTFLPEDWQPYHTYLQMHAKKTVEKSNERKYMDDDITLQEYEDLKYPDRKKKKDEEALVYPLVYNVGTCIIDGSSNGVIKCLNCPNLICRDCIIREFLSGNVSSGSFMMMHRRFCMRFGQVPPIESNVEPPPGYLTELRLTGKLAAEKRLGQNNANDELSDDEVEDNDTDGDTVDMEAVRKEEEKKRFAEAIDEIHKLMEKTQRKFWKHKTEIIKLQVIIDDKKKTEQMRERSGRLKYQEIERYRNTLPKREAVDLAYASLDPKILAIDKTIKDKYGEFCLIIDQIERLIISNSLQAYQDREEELIEIERIKKQRALQNQIGIS